MKNVTKRLPVIVGFFLLASGNAVADEFSIYVDESNPRAQNTLSFRFNVDSDKTDFNWKHDSYDRYSTEQNASQFDSVTGARYDWLPVDSSQWQ